MQSQNDDQLRLSKYLGDRYHELFKVGEGGMGVVYRAYDRNLDRLVAIKVLRPAGSAELVRRFQQEARAAAKLKHDNAIRELDCGVLPDNGLYIVMEFLDGISLEKLVLARGKLSTKQALPIFMQIVAGMEHAHGIGLLHRDLKPSNIILIEMPPAPPVAKIVDFGLAIATDSIDDTTSNTFSGSPLYMAPEASESRLVGERSDIYSLGCLMMYCLTAAPPFNRKSILEIIIDHRETPPPRLSERLPAGAVNADLDRIIAKCLNKNPDDRYQSMHELYTALSAVKIESPAEAETELFEKLVVSTPESPAPRGRRGLIWTALILLILCAGGYAAVCNINDAAKIDSTPELSKEVSAKKERAIHDSLVNDLFEHKFAERLFNGGKWIYNQPPIEESDFKELAERNDIDRLWIHESDVNGTGLKYLAKNRIGSLAFVDCAVDAAGIEEIAKFKTIVILRLIRAPFLTDDSLLPLPAALNLHTLYLSECSRLTSDSVRTVARFKGLRKLSVKDMKQYDSPALEQLAALRNLEILCISGTAIDTRGFHFLRKLKHLNALDVGRTSLTDANIDDIALPAMEALSVRETDVTLAGLTKLKRCKKLRLLDVRDCKNIGANEVYKLQSELPDVAIVNRYRTTLSFPSYEDDLLMWVSPH